MGRTLAHLPRVLAWGTLASACAPEWGDEVTVAADAGATADARWTLAGRTDP